MPAGGIWTVQNKQRPGAYINFVSAPSALGAVGERGIITCALPMTWGPASTLITLYGTDLLDGKSLAKVGCTAFDTDESLPYRLALSGCSKALLFRADTGGVKATATITGTGETLVKADAKYAGTTGNKLSVKITAATPTATQSTVDVYLDSVAKERFVVTTLEPDELVAIVSEWVDFTCGASVTTVPATAGVTLESGANGSVDEATYATYFNLITTEQWQTLAIDSSTGTAPALIGAKIASMRNDLGRKVQAVVYNDVSLDSEGIIAVKQGFKTATDTVPVNLFPLWVASQTAGAQINESKTGYVVPGATEITGYIAENEVADALAAGWFVLSYRQDGAVCVEQDINSLHTFTPDKGYAFCKNRVIRCLDEIANSIALIFNKYYLGKVDNNTTGRNLFKNDLISYFNQLQGINAITNFGGPDDLVINQGLTLDSVVVDVDVQPVDSMEKLYMTVNVVV